MKKLLTICVLLSIAVASFAAKSSRSKERVLLDNYLRYQVSKNVMSQATDLASHKDSAIKDEVQQEAAWWLTAQNKRIKSDLEATFGDDASTEFQEFWINYEKAEAANDVPYLDGLKKAADAGDAADYAALRKAILKGVLARDVANSGALLSAVEGWLDAVDEGKLPQGSLKKWINGDISVRKKVISDPLQAAEAEAEPFVVDPKAKDDNPLDSFKAMRDAKRKKAHDEAKDGMAQVASERTAAEAEYAAKVQARATAEAANLKKHADRLSSAEKEAFEQRKKSFGNRLKNVVSATVGAATGAFSGGIGARAGQAAVNSIWGPSAPAYTQPLPPGGGAQPPAQPPAQP